MAPHGNPLVPRKPDWDSFLSDEQVSKDAPIPQTWGIMANLLSTSRNRVIFITGRNEKTRDMTVAWLTDEDCPIRWSAASYFPLASWPIVGPHVYMRSENDRRPSDQVKRDLLNKARADGFNPTLVFEDRKEDAAMWRSEGLLCCQVAEGDY